MLVAHVDGEEEPILERPAAHEAGQTAGQGSVGSNMIFGLPQGLESPRTDGALPGGAVQLLQVFLLLLFFDIFVLDLRFNPDLQNFCKNNKTRFSVDDRHQRRINIHITTPTCNVLGYGSLVLGLVSWFGLALSSGAVLLPQVLLQEVSGSRGVAT